MKNHLTLFLLLCVLSACNEKSVNFTYAPTTPKAGQNVEFTNLSNFGETWQWNFGDNTTSIIKNPKHVYKKAGVYTVVMTIDSVSRNRCVKTIEIYDSVPSFVSSSDSILPFDLVTFHASIWNPFNKAITYRWAVDSNSIVESSSLEEKDLSLRFTKANSTVKVNLTITMGDETFDIEKSYTIHDSKTMALLARTESGDYCQRIFHNTYLEEPRALNSSSPQASHLLDITQDTVYTYNGYKLTCDNLNIEGHDEILGFVVDPLSHKIYFREIAGLWVANIDGTSPVMIDIAYPTALAIDRENDRIYWSGEDGIMRMPLVHSSNNRFTTTPENCSNLNSIQKICIDYELY